ncbi:MAG: TerB family tellurite resistance protein [Candidatus Cloacimonetes bacterium]|nr:TerB family tellurite resistance protein [Candidatus Cloacimonadota bacterium]
MSRWSVKIKEKIDVLSSFRESKHFLDSFYISKVYEPQTEQEKSEFDDFSLVTSSMALLIHIAKADKIVKQEEKERIISDLIYQLEQRPYEFGNLAEKFGATDRKIIETMFDKLLDDYEKKKIDLNEIIKIIELIYKNNIKKKYYIIRLCYYCAFSDNDLDIAEKEAISEIASKLKINTDQIERIEREVKLELA